MRERLQTLVACDDCGRGYPIRELVTWPYLPLLLCVECERSRREEMGEGR